MANVTIVNQPTQVQTVSPGGQQANTPDAGRQAPTLAQGTVVSGTIIGKDTNGNFVLRTASDGNISLHSSTPLTYNSDVDIRIGASGAGGTTARIVSVNGQPFETAAQAPEESDSLSDSLLAQASQSTPASASQTASTATQTVRAVVVTAPAPQPAPAAANTGTTAPPAPQTATPQSIAAQNAGTLNSGDNVVLHVQAQQSPAVTAQQTDTAPPPVTTSEQAATTPQPNVTQQQAVPTAQQGVTVPQSIVSTAGTELSGAQVVPQINDTAVANAQQTSSQSFIATVQDQAAPQAQAAQPQAQSPSTALYAAYAKQSGVAITAPSPATAQAAPAAASQTQLVPAQVASINEDGTVTLQTSLGTVTVQPEALPAGATLAPGASVQIEIPAAAVANPLAVAIPLSSTPAPLSEIALSWTTLKDIIAATGDTSPENAIPGTPASAQASPALANLPQLGANFAASSLTFISAVAEGNLRKLLGDDTIDALKQNGRTDLIDKFSGELDNISQSMTQAAARPMPTWQMIFMPFVYQESLQQARIYIKRDQPKKEKSSEQSSGDTRFIVEVDLSEIGPLQMDGLVRKQEQNTAFDLVIRSHNGFSDEEKRDISGIYADAAAMTGFKGSLSFQVTPDFPVKPLDDAPASAGRSITV